MLDAGRVFAAVPPLHRIELTNPRKGQQKHIYTYSDAELRRTLLELESKGKRWKDPCSGTRASARWTRTSSPRRPWTRATAPCGGSGSRTPRPPPTCSACSWAPRSRPRRDFIIGGATELDLSRIDT